MNKLTYSLAISLMITGCGGSSDSTSSVITTVPVAETQKPGAPYISPATLATETAFTDSFVTNNTGNISWAGPAASSSTNVDYIAQAFNTARAVDPTVKEKLRMPLQAIWDSYNTSEKVIYLINSERSARSMRPFRGIAPELVNSAELYSAELSANGVFSHNYGTYTTPTERLAGWANVIAPPQTSAPTGTENATYNTYYIEELIAYIQTSGSTIYEPEARAIYNFMYQDKSPTFGGAYAHRNSILIKNPAEAVVPSIIQTTNARPIIGASSSDGIVSGMTRSTLVVHGVDPNANWDLSNVTESPALIGPESVTDCLSGTFTESQDDTGNNTSVCQ